MQNSDPQSILHNLTNHIREVSNECYDTRATTLAVEAGFWTDEVTTMKEQAWGAVFTTHDGVVYEAHIRTPVKKINKVIHIGLVPHGESQTKVEFVSKEWAATNISTVRSRS